MYYIILIFILLIYYVLYFDSDSLVNEYYQVMNLIIEDDLEYYGNKVKNKNLKQLFNERIMFTSLSMFILLCFRTNIILIFVLGTIIYYGYYYLLKNSYYVIVKKTNDKFPYYLNNLAILIQQNAVPVAINKSIEHAPNVFKDELKVLVNEIHHDAGSIQPYLTFAKKFENIEDINRIMRTIYNLALKSSNRDVMITSLSKITNEKLNTQIKLEFKNKLDSLQTTNYLLFLWLGFLILSMITNINLF